VDVSGELTLSLLQCPPGSLSRVQVCRSLISLGKHPTLGVQLVRSSCSVSSSMSLSHLHRRQFCLVLRGLSQPVVPPSPILYIPLSHVLSFPRPHPLHPVSSSNRPFAPAFLILSSSLLVIIPRHLVVTVVFVALLAAPSSSRPPVVVSSSPRYIYGFTHVYLYSSCKIDWSFVHNKINKT
jgi:hypothetical protein